MQQNNTQPSRSSIPTVISIHTCNGTRGTLEHKCSVIYFVSVFAEDVLIVPLFFGIFLCICMCFYSYSRYCILVVVITGVSFTQVASKANSSRVIIQVRWQPSAGSVIDENWACPIRCPWSPHDDQILRDRIQISMPLLYDVLHMYINLLYHFHNELQVPGSITSLMGGKSDI